MSKQSFAETLVSAPVAGTALTAASAASMLPAQSVITIAPGYFQVGTRLAFRASGIISSAITTPGTARFDIRLGSVVVWDSLAVLLDTAVTTTTAAWILEVELTCRAIGNGVNSNFIGIGRWSCADILGVAATPPKANAIAMLPWNSAPVVGTSFDNVVNGTLDCFFTQTVNTGSLQCLTWAVTAYN